jgi:hypothetical protein
MPALHEVQSGLIRTLMGRHDGSAAQLLLRAGTVPSAQRRLQIYRNNLFETRIAALGAVYPVVARLVGVDFFRCAARAYSQLYPMRCGDLHEFGDRLPEFLRDYVPAAGLPYLADVARLEWAYHRAYHEAQLPALDPIRLGRVPLDLQGSVRLQMQPSADLIRSRYPILRIWQANQPEASDAESRILLDEGGVSLLVAQHDLEIEFRRLDEAESRFLCALAFGESLEQATRDALGSDPDFDLAATLARHLARGLFVGLSLPEADQPT